MMCDTSESAQFVYREKLADFKQMVVGFVSLTAWLPLLFALVRTLPDILLVLVESGGRKAAQFGWGKLLTFSPLIPIELKLLWVDAVEVVWIAILSRVNAREDDEPDATPPPPPSTPAAPPSPRSAASCHEL